MKSFLKSEHSYFYKTCFSRNDQMLVVYSQINCVRKIDCMGTSCCVLHSQNGNTCLLSGNKHNNCLKILLLEIIRLQIFHNCFIKTYMNRKDPSEWMSPDCVVMCAPILLLQWHPRCSKFRIRMMKFNAKITICRPWKSTNKVVVQLYRTHWVSKCANRTYPRGHSLTTLTRFCPLLTTYLLALLIYCFKAKFLYTVDISSPAMYLVPTLSC